MLQQRQTRALEELARRDRARDNQSAKPIATTPTDTARPQLEAAKALIDAKQYGAARKLLKTIDHPKATEWLVKLEKIT